MAPSLEAIRMTKRFGSFAAVSGLSLRIQGTKLVGILGLNGERKITEIKVLATIMNKTSGNVSVEGLDIEKRTGAIRRTIGAQSQKTVADADLDVRKVIK